MKRTDYKGGQATRDYGSNSRANAVFVAPLAHVSGYERRSENTKYIHTISYYQHLSTTRD